MATLFDDDPDARAEAGDAPPARTPLAERMRPRTLDEIVGQAALLAPGRPLREAIDADVLQSIILWGPPGTGKTTLARVIADTTKARFIAYSAVMSGIKEIKAVMAEAEETRRRLGRRTMLFVDEIHRFNKAQQDAFLPRVEAGDLVLIGATTENPSFEVNAALLSRSKVFVLQPLDEAAIAEILHRAWRDAERGLGLETPPHAVTLAEDGAAAVARYASGDARVALNALELVGGYASRRGVARRGRDARRRSCSSSARCSTTRAAKSTSTSSRRCTNRCATRIPTPRSTGSPGCSRPARIRCTSPGGWSASPPKTSGSPIRRRCR